jgi:hypothetical protein
VKCLFSGFFPCHPLESELYGVGSTTLYERDCNEAETRHSDARLLSTGLLYESERVVHIKWSNNSPTVSFLSIRQTSIGDHAGHQIPSPYKALLLALALNDANVVEESGFARLQLSVQEANKVL